MFRSRTARSRRRKRRVFEVSDMSPAPAFQTRHTRRPTIRRTSSTLTESGKSSEAVKILDPMAQSNDPDVLNAFGIALADRGDVDRASQQFQRVLQRDPNNAPALQNLGIVALRRDDVRSAQQYLSRA